MKTFTSSVCKLITLSFFVLFTVSAFANNGTPSFKLVSSALYTNNNSFINITNFTAHEKGNKLFIDWATDGTVPTNYFEVQRSNDGKVFSTVAIVLGPDPQQAGDKYQYMEKVKNVISQPVYFRLKHISTNGEIQLTKIIQM